MEKHIIGERQAWEAYRGWWLVMQGNEAYGAGSEEVTEIATTEEDSDRVGQMARSSPRSKSVNYCKRLRKQSSGCSEEL